MCYLSSSNNPTPDQVGPTQHNNTYIYISIHCQAVSEVGPTSFPKPIREEMHLQRNFRKKKYLETASRNIKDQPVVFSHHVQHDVSVFSPSISQEPLTAPPVTERAHGVQESLPPPPPSLCPHLPLLFFMTKTTSLIRQPLSRSLCFDCSLLCCSLLFWGVLHRIYGDTIGSEVDSVLCTFTQARLQAGPSASQRTALLPLPSAHKSHSHTWIPHQEGKITLTNNQGKGRKRREEN